MGGFKEWGLILLNQTFSAWSVSVLEQAASHLLPIPRMLKMEVEIFLFSPKTSIIGDHLGSEEYCPLGETFGFKWN